MSTVLEEICAKKRIHVATCKSQTSLAQLETAIANSPPPRGFYQALRHRAADTGYSLICEIKKASPSKGLIRADFEPASLARAYEQGGASCLSVLTDTPYFQGADEHFKQARAACGLPMLRKDFMLDPYQVLEARAMGADCILIIMAALEDDDARDLSQLARDLGMDVLVEVHDQAELERGLALDLPLIGVNNRNLKTLAVDIQTTVKLASLIPDDRLLVCESGLKGRNTLIDMQAVGAKAFLIGESLMRETDVAAATKAILPDPAMASTP
ncbi:MAG: indole-3-glycerol phosphate synthase TrpC [Pseudomonadota bacterium]